MSSLTFMLLWIISNVASSEGHGMLWEPPSRSTMWRRGFHTPINPNDNELNCGGYENHWIKQGGRCGICGDPYQSYPRENEAGGKYATGTIARKYSEGRVIDLLVDLTANHVGYMEFHICPLNSTQKVTQACLDSHPIHILGTDDGKYRVGSRENGRIGMHGKLPNGVTCSHCVIQWHYTAGNRWNCDKQNKCGKGRGPQEEFFGCADVEIRRREPRRKLTSSTNTKQKTRTLIHRKSVKILDKKQREYKQQNRQNIQAVRPSKIINRYKMQNISNVQSISKMQKGNKVQQNKSQKVIKVQESHPSNIYDFLNQAGNLDKRNLDHVTRQLVLHNLTVKEQEMVPSLLGTPIDLLENINNEKHMNLGKHMNLFKEKLNITIGTDDKKAAILQEMGELLWSLLKAVMQASDKQNGDRLSLVRMKPVGDFSQLSDIADQVSLTNSRKQWPPISPMVVEANIKDIKGNQPMIMDEVDVFKELKESNNNKSRMESGVPSNTSTPYKMRCHGIRHHRHIKGISNWCTSNCRQGNCPNHICECRIENNGNHKFFHGMQDQNRHTKATVTEQAFPDPTFVSSSKTSRSSPILVKHVIAEEGKKQKHVSYTYESKIDKQPILNETGINNKINANPSSIDHEQDKRRTEKRNEVRKQGHYDLSRGFDNEHSVKKVNKEVYTLPKLQKVNKEVYTLPKLQKRMFQRRESKAVRNSRNQQQDNPILQSRPDPTQNSVTYDSNFDAKQFPLMEKLSCEGVGEFARRNKMTHWCEENCSKGFCPKRLCKCKYPDFL